MICLRARHSVIEANTPAHLGRFIRRVGGAEELLQQASMLVRATTGPMRNLDDGIDDGTRLAAMVSAPGGWLQAVDRVCGQAPDMLNPMRRAGARLDAKRSPTPPVARSRGSTVTSDRRHWV